MSTTARNDAYVAAKKAVIKPRAKGRGAITYEASTGLYIGRIDLPSPDGKRRRTKRASKDYAECVKKLDAVANELIVNGDVATGVPTVEQFFAEYVKRARLRPNVLSGYESSMRVWVLPHIGSSRIDKVKVKTLQKIVDAPVNLKPVPRSPSVSAGVHTVLSTVYREAFRAEYVRENPMRRVVKPTAKKKGSKRALVSLSPEQGRRLILTEGGDTLALVWFIALFTGMRRGEVLGLQWSHVDFKKGVIDVEYQLTQIPRNARIPDSWDGVHITGGMWLDEPKSDAGRRIVPLIEPLWSYLYALREHSATGEGLVITKPDGMPYSPGYVSKAWVKAMRAAGVPKEDHVRLHDVRHTFVDLMLDSGVDERLVQAMVGHSTRAMTRAYRTRESPEQLHAAMSMFIAQVRGGVANITPLGATGSAPALSASERPALVGSVGGGQ